MRDSEDSRRYMKLYGIDNNDYAFVDLVIDATATPDEIVEKIISKLADRGFVEF